MRLACLAPSLLRTPRGTPPCRCHPVASARPIRKPRTVSPCSRSASPSPWRPASRSWNHRSGSGYPASGAPRIPPPRARCPPACSRRPQGRPHDYRKSYAPLVLNRAAAIFCDTAKPTEFAMPWPSGPVVASTPGVSNDSGCPGVPLSNCRKQLDLIERDIEPRKMQPRVKEHAAMARGEDEAVPVEPARIVRVQVRASARKAPRRFPRNPAAAPGARVASVHRIHCKTARLIGRPRENFGI